MRNMRRIPQLLSLLLLGALGVGPARVAAQQEPPRAPGGIVERVVAVVGGSLVTFTELQEYLQVLQASGQKLPTDPAAIAKIQEDALSTLIDQMLITQAAAKDTLVTPDEDEIETRVNQMLDQTTQRV